MNILILGGGGMIGRKLAASLNDSASLTLVDVAFPPDFELDCERISGDLGDQTLIKQLAARRFDAIVHLAAVVSGEAERDFAKGWSVNTLSLFALLDALANEHSAAGGRYRPRFVFTSSLAVFGPPYPDAIPDDFPLRPRSSYGAQKAACELMIADATRKGYIEGLSLRLPTICVRPGKPNAAASSFYSGIIREPLAGEKAVLPVSKDIRHWFASPRSAVGFLRHALDMPSDKRNGITSLNLPGVSCTVGEQIEALRRVAGDEAVALIEERHDPAIEAIVSGWPQRFDPVRALQLGFEADQDFDAIIAAYLGDDA